MKKVLLTTLMSLMMCMGVYAQDYDWKMPIQPSDIVIGEVETSKYAGEYSTCFVGGIKDTRCTIKDEKLYEALLKTAQTKYSNDYPNLKLRNFKSEKQTIQYKDQYGRSIDAYKYYYQCTATVVVPNSKVTLSNAVSKALRNVQQGSRIAIDQINMGNGFNYEDYKDQLIDILLDKGYRVVAKEYLQKLDKEIKDAIESGQFNPETMVEGNNFSAVGYFINVKVTESSIRVQVVDVSKGEYVGNATVNF